MKHLQSLKGPNIKKMRTSNFNKRGSYFQRTHSQSEDSEKLDMKMLTKLTTQIMTKKDKFMTQKALPSIASDESSDKEEDETKKRRNNFIIDDFKTIKE